MAPSPSTSVTWVSGGPAAGFAGVASGVAGCGRGADTRHSAKKVRTATPSTGRPILTARCRFRLISVEF
jgi:hypothetical protein